MRKWIPLLIFLLCIVVPGVRMLALPISNTLSGTIRDSDHKPLPGAIVEIPDLKKGTVSDNNGNYHIDNLPKGTYVVVVNMISFSTVTRTININQDTKQDFKLDESAIEAHEVVVTGQSKATEIRKSPEPIVTISAQYLKENESTNIIDAISKIPGIKSVTTGPNVSKPFIRGLGYNRVLTLYDGMRQEGQQWGDEHGIEVDQYNVDRVEVIKGPSSLIYGSDAMAGVVNLIPAKPVREGTILGRISTDYQTNNGTLSGSAMLAGTQNGFYWMGRVSHKQAKDYQDPVDGRVYGTRYDETDISATAGVKKKWGFSQLQFALFDDLQAIPDGSRDSATRKFTRQITEADTVRPIVPNNELNSYAMPVLHQRVQHYRAMMNNNIIAGNGSIGLNVGFERSVRQEFSHPEYGSTPGLYLQLNSFLYDVKYYAAQVKGWDITAGINGMYQVNDVTKGTEFVIPSYSQFDIGPFITGKKNFGKLNISAGMRYDSRSFHDYSLSTRPDPVTGFDMAYTGGDTTGTSVLFKSYSHTFTGMTYSGGLTYTFSKHFAAKANVSRGFRAPNIAEISTNGVHPGTNIYQLGNSNFKPEFGLQEDIGVDYTSRHVSGTLAVFNNNISDYIYNRKLDTTIVKGNETFQFSATQAQLYGGEISIDIHPHPLDWLHFENSLSVVYALNKGTKGITPGDSDRYLPYIPPLHGLSELSASFKKPQKWLAHSFAKFQVEYYSQQNRVFSAYATETPTTGYVLLNAALGTEILDRKGNVLFNIYIFGNNLADVAYHDHLSRLKYFEFYPNDPRGHSGIYNMGRNFGIKIEIPLYLKHAS